MKNFRTYQIAVELYKAVVPLRLPAHIKKQLLASSASVAANLAEGYGKSSSADQCRFFDIAYGSCKETQCWLQLGGFEHQAVGQLADKLGAHLFQLLRRSRR